MDELTYFTAPAFAVLFPLIMTPIILFAGRRSEKLRNALALATTAAVFLDVVSLFPRIVAGEVIEFTLFEILPQMDISFRVDLLSFSLSVLAALAWLLCTVYSIDYMAREHAGSRFYPVLIFTLGSCQGIFMAGDLFTLFIFFEMMSLMAYVLVIHEETAEAMQAGYKYLIMTIIGGLALFFGIIETFELAGNVSFSSGPLIEQASLPAFFAFISFLIGFGMKAGIFPLHVWLPDAHPVAPSPASALLSGIMLKTGAYGLLRVVFYVFEPEVIQNSGWDTIMGVLAVITILLGSAVALTQDDIKRRLAYSSIGQMGYILLGISLFTESALIGAIFHIFSHAFMKMTLFLTAGAIIMKSGRRLVSEMAGIGRMMPVTLGCFSLAALSMIGIPPLNGFLSKWTLGIGALEANMPVYLLVLLISSLLNALYYLPLIVPAFFGGLDNEHRHGFTISEVSPRMLAPIVILTLAILLFGLLPTNIPFELSRLTAEYLLKGGIF